MKILKKESLQKMRFYTNSTINLIPQLSEESKKINFVWKRRHYIKALNQSQIITTNYQYLCSPLDENCYIDVQIDIQNKNKQTRTLGPIQLQTKLTLISLPNAFQTRVILNKNVPYQAKICFVPHQKQIFKLQIQGQKMAFDSQFICCQRWKHLEPSPTDPNVILLNIKPIKKQFLNFIKKLFIPVHFGDSLKIMFQDRFSKDVFLLRAIEWSPSSSLSYEKQHKDEQIVIPLDESKKFSDYTSFNIKKSELRDDTSVDLKIMQDIYDVLYTPKVNQHDALRREFETDNFYRNQIKLDSNNQLSNRTTQTIKKGQNKNDNVFIEQSFGHASTKKDPKEEHNMNLQHTSKPNIGYSQNNKPNKNNNQMIQIFLNDPQKIQQLININQQLIEENQKLKKENSILKNQREKYINNIKQLDEGQMTKNYSCNSLNTNYNFQHRQYRQSEDQKNFLNFTNWNMPTTPSSADTYQITQLKDMIQQMSKRIIRLQEKQKINSNQINQNSLIKKNSIKGQFKLVVQTPTQKNQTNQFKKNEKTSYQINQINFGNTNNNHFIHYQSYSKKIPISSFSSPTNQATQQFGHIIKPSNNLSKTHTGYTNEKLTLEKIPTKKPSFLDAKVNNSMAYQRHNSKSPIKRRNE